MTNKRYDPPSNLDELRLFIKKIPILGGLNSKQLDDIFKLLRTVKYDKGEYVYKRGDALSFIYIIKQGEVKLKIEENNVFLDLINLRSGECFGETSVIGIQSHFSNALVVEPTELIVLEPSKLLKIYEDDKETFGMLILNIARETARRMHHSNETLVQYMLNKDIRLD